MDWATVTKPTADPHASSVPGMTTRTDTLLAGQYFLAVQGFAIIRSCLTDPSATRPRLDEVREIAEHLGEFPHSLEIPMTEHDVVGGYTEWSSRYGGPNPAIACEEPVVHALLDAMPVGFALDAACGTGRHAARLSALGHEVIGVDATPAMLDVARTNVPAADFRLGRLEELPVEDGSVDLITCALALTHVVDLAPVMREMSRVLRPGGRAVLSDIHPLNAMTGGIAGFPDGAITDGIPYVRNLVHHVSEYVGAFGAAGLRIVDCLEPLVTESLLPNFPSYALFPDATRQAFLDAPYLLIWELER
ncbi:hypothetical protein BH24ACT3_BH24ACT3_04710 [soil metagenome]